MSPTAQNYSLTISSYHASNRTVTCVVGDVIEQLRDIAVGGLLHVTVYVSLDGSTYGTGGQFLFYNDVCYSCNAIDSCEFKV